MQRKTTQQQSTPTYYARSMKPTIYLALAIAATLLFSCSTTETVNDSVLYLKVRSTLSGKDSTAYVSNDFVWYNSTTKELKFVNPPTLQKLQSYGQMKFYVGSDSLFTAKIVTDAVSAIVNDLVLYMKTDGKFYLEDGYPLNLGDATLRAQNKDKRAAAWSKFIIQMKKDKHYAEQ